MTRHDEFRSLLQDFVDFELPADKQDAVALHLAECEECSAEVDALHALRAAAQDLPAAVAPDRDLWADIEARIGAEEAQPGTCEPTDPPARTGRTAAGRPAHWTSRLVWAAAAVFALAVVWPQGSADNASLQDLTMTYRMVRHDGVIALSNDDTKLDASSRGTMSAGMSAIDDAIRETQAALEAAADAPEQFRHLADGYQKKIDLLQRLVRRAARP